DLLEAAARALDELGLASWVADLPDGIRTRLGEGGYVLSAGREQLVAFARILVRDPHVVILDEATARMDPVTEARLQRATERLLRGRSRIVGAHRLASGGRRGRVVGLACRQGGDAGPLRESRRFARLLATSQAAAPSAAAPSAAAPSAAGAGHPAAGAEGTVATRRVAVGVGAGGGPALAGPGGPG